MLLLQLDFQWLITFHDMLPAGLSLLEGGFGESRLLICISVHSDCHALPCCGRCPSQGLCCSWASVWELLAALSFTAFSNDLMCVVCHVVGGVPPRACVAPGPVSGLLAVCSIMASRLVYDHMGPSFYVVSCTAFYLHGARGCEGVKKFRICLGDPISFS